MTRPMTFNGLATIAFCVWTVWTRCSEPVAGERVLALSPISARSHWNFMRGVLKALTDSGHQVTVFTPFPEGDRENYTEVDMSREIDSLVRLDLSVVNDQLTEHGDLINFVLRYSRDTCKVMFENGAFEAAVAESNAVRRYDVVIVELMGSECVSYASALLGVPLVYVIPPPLVSYLEPSILGHWANPATVSHLLADHGVPRTFGQRFANTALLLYTTWLLRYKEWKAAKSDPQPFDLVDPVKPSVVFSNAHYITDAPRPIPPNVIPIGGIHLCPPKEIPDDILKFIENSPQGVIYFTLGSVVAMASVPKQVKTCIINVLGRVPQRVLFKYEDDDMVDVPKNMMVKKWFPQRDVLAHPNVKLFISHGGISGLYEAVDAGVPVLGFPVFFDQTRNIDNLVEAGMAILMDLESVTEPTFSKAITKLVNDKKYAKNAKRVSKVFGDRPMSPARSVDYWIRYVVRHNGASHLRYRGLDLAWYQSLLLDVVFATASLLLSIVYAARVAFRRTYRRYRQTSIPKSKLQ